MWNFGVKVKVRVISFLLRKEWLRPNVGFKQHFWIRNAWLGRGIAKTKSMEIFHVLLEHTVHML